MDRANPCGTPSTQAIARKICLMPKKLVFDVIRIHSVLLGRLLALMGAFFAMPGCLSVPVTYATQQEEAESKLFKSPEGLSRVYVFRDEQFGWMHPLTLSIDERRIGDFAAKTYALFDLPPGSYEFSSSTPESNSQVLVNAEAGSINYLWLEMKMGWMYPRVLLHHVDDERGHEGVTNSKMIILARRNQSQRGGSGTAWLVSSRHWVTNRHVVGDRKSVTLLGPNGSEVHATVVTTDQANDLALLVTDAPLPGAKPIPIAQQPAKVGERVIVIGFPLPDQMGAKAKLTTGDVSALSGSVDDPRFYQFSAPIQPGNSGGPLLNSSGEVIGIVSSKLNSILIANMVGSIPEGVSYAVKIAYLRPMLEGIQLEGSTVVKPLTPDAVFDAYAQSVYQVKP